MSKIFRIISLCLACVTVLLAFSGCGNQTEVVENPNGLKYGTFQEFLDNSVHMHPETDKNLRYALYDNFAQVIECISDEEHIVIPDTYKNLPVIGIRANSFEDRDKLKSITFGSNLLCIEDSAFKNCISLTQVKMSSSINEIGPNAFAGCEALTSIVIPPMVDTICAGTFSGCSSLKKVVVEASERALNSAEVQRVIEGGAFSDCSHLAIMWIPEDIVEVPESILGGSTPKPLICGGDSTASSYFATLQCLDYELVNRDDFDAHARLYSNYDLVDRTEAGHTITAGLFEIRLDEVKYYDKLGAYTSGPNQTLVAISFTITQDSKIAQYFDGLNVKCISVAPGQDNVVKEFHKTPLMLSSQVLGKKYPTGYVYPETEMKGVIVLRVSDRFESIQIQFGDATEAFII